MAGAMGRWKQCILLERCLIDSGCVVKRTFCVGERESDDIWKSAQLGKAFEACSELRQSLKITT